MYEFYGLVVLDRKEPQLEARIHTQRSSSLQGLQTSLCQYRSSKVSIQVEQVVGVWPSRYANI